MFTFCACVHKRPYLASEALVNAVVNAGAKDVTVGKENSELLACLWVHIKQDVVISHAGKSRPSGLPLPRNSADHNDLSECCSTSQ